MESLRRSLLDLAARHGFEYVVPPLLEHLESLLSGTAGELDLHTFKLVDQLSGRTLGLRADTTPQAARIDAHLLNRSGVTRLCYCGPVLHARPEGAAASRELLQFGAEIFGHTGLEADLQVQELALEGVAQAVPGMLMIDLADARILRGVLGGLALDAHGQQEIVGALSAKDVPRLETLSRALPPGVRQGLVSLARLYGGAEVLEQARAALPQAPDIGRALDDLAWLAAHLQSDFPSLCIGFDLADMGGYAYYSGPRFAVYGAASRAALARGGRYDEVGSVFGRNRPAAGFSLDVRSLAACMSEPGPAPAIRAEWSQAPHQREAVRRLRDAGETVVYRLPGEGAEPDALACDRELVHAGGRWLVRACEPAPTAADPTTT